MAKVIETADLTFRPGASMEVVCAVRMPVGEFAAFLALAGMTNGVPAHLVSWIAVRFAAGNNSGG